jgi:hypothetical protein
VSRVGTLGTAAAVTDANRSDVVTSANGSVVLRTSTGDLLLADGTATRSDSALAVAGSGGVRLEALAGQIFINSDVSTDGGHLTILASSGISIGSASATDADVRAGGQGSVLLDAGAGALTFDGTASLDAAGNAQLRAGTTVTLGEVKGSAVSVAAANGSIISSTGSPQWAIAPNALKLDAAGAIGTPTAPFALDVGKLAARTGGTGNAGLFLRERNDLVVDSVSAPLKLVGIDGQLTDQSDAGTGDLVVAAGTGAIVLTTEAGSIELREGRSPDVTTPVTDAGTAVSTPGSGNILIRANGTGSTLTIRGDVRSGSGDITLMSEGSLSVGSEAIPGVDIVTGQPAQGVAASTVLMESRAGSVLMRGTSAVGAPGDVLILADQDISLGSVSAEGFSAKAAKGKASVGEGGAPQTRVSELLLAAVGSIGTAASPLRVEGGRLSAQSESGDIYLQSKGELRVVQVGIDVREVQANGSSVTKPTLSQNGIRSTTSAPSTVGIDVEQGNLVIDTGLIRADTVRITTRQGYVVDGNDGSSGNFVDADLDVDARRLILDAPWGALAQQNKLVLLDGFASRPTLSDGTNAGQFLFGAIGDNDSLAAIEYAVASQTEYESWLYPNKVGNDNGPADIPNLRKYARTLEFVADREPARAITLAAMNNPNRVDDRGELRTTGLKVTGTTVRFETAVVADLIDLDVGPVSGGDKGLLVLNGKLKASGLGGVNFSDRAFDVQVPSTFRVAANPATGAFELGGPALGDVSVRRVDGKLILSREGSVVEIANPETVTFNLRAGEVLTGAADAFSNLRIAGAGSVVLSTVTATPPTQPVLLNLSNIAGSTLTLAVPASATLDAGSNIGQFKVRTASGQTLTLSAAQASGKSINGTGSVTTTGLGAGGAAVDLTGVISTGMLLAEAVPGAVLTTATSLNPRFVIQSAGAAGAAQSLTIASGLANGRLIRAAGEVVVTGINGTAVDLTRVQAIGNTALSRRLVIANDTTLAAATDLGGFGIDIASGRTLTLGAGQASGRSVIGAGSVQITGVDDRTLDFSQVSVSGTRSATLASGASLVRLDAGTVMSAVTLSVGAGQTLALSAAQATRVATDGGRVVGAGTTRISDLGTVAANLSAIQTTRVEATLSASVSTLAAGTVLGTAIVSIPAGRSLALSAAQLNGARLEGAGTLVLTGPISSSTSLAGAATQTVDLTSAALAATTGAGTEITLSSSSRFVVTPQQLQATKLRGNAANNTLIVDVSGLSFNPDTSGTPTAIMLLDMTDSVGGNDTVSFRFGQGSTERVVRLDPASVIKLGQIGNGESNTLESNNGVLDISRVPLANLGGFSRVVVNSALTVSVEQMKQLLDTGGLSEFLGDGVLTVEGAIDREIDLRKIASFLPGGAVKPEIRFVSATLSSVKDSSTAGAGIILPPSGSAVQIRLGSQLAPGFDVPGAPIAANASVVVFNGRQLEALTTHPDVANIASLTLSGDIAIAGSVNLGAGGPFRSGLALVNSATSINVATGATLTLSAAQANLAMVGGAGQVRVTGLSQYLAAQGVPSFDGLSAATTVVIDSTMTLPGAVELGHVGLEVAAGATVTVSAAQASGRSINAGTGAQSSLVITGLGGGTVDFTRVASGLASQAQVSSNLTVSSGSLLGPVALALADGAQVVMSASQASGRAVTGSGSLSLIGLDAAPFNLSAIAVPTSAVIGRSIEVNPASVLGNRLTLQVADDVSLTLTAAQATTGSDSGISGRSITGTGSVVVTGLGSARVMLNNISVAGTVTAQASASAALDGETNLGGASIRVGAGATLTMTPAQTLVGSGSTAVARDMAGEGALQLAGAAGTAASPAVISGANLSASELTLVVNTHQNLSGVSLGASPIVVNSGASATLSAAQAGGRKVSGEGQVIITALGASPQADLSGVTAASATALISSSTIFKGALGKTQLVISPAVALTINGAIVSGVTVTGGGRLIIVTGEIAGPTGNILSPSEALTRFDLSKVAKSITIEGRLNSGTELETDSVDIKALGQLAGANDVVQLRPTVDTKGIRLAGASNASSATSLFVNTTDLRTLEVKELVVGSYTGKHIIDVGDSGNAQPIVFNVPLTLQAPVAGGHINLNQQIQGESLKIYGSGATTSLNNDVSMSDDVFIDDRVIVTGGRTIVARTAVPGGTGADGIRITGDVVDGNANGTDSLTLTAGGYDITFNKSVSLNAMTLSNFDDLKFEGDVTIDGGTLDITAGAGDTVRFGGRVTLLNGAKLLVNGAAGGTSDMVIFDGGLAIGGTAAAAAVSVTLSNIDQVVLNNAAATAGAAGNFTINNAAEVKLTARSGAGARTLVEAMRSDGAGLNFGLPQYPAKTGLSSPAAASVMALGSIDLVVNAAGTLQFNRGFALLGGSTLDINGGTVEGATNRVIFDGGLRSDVTGARTTQVSIENVTSVDFGALSLPANPAIAATASNLRLSAVVEGGAAGRLSQVEMSFAGSDAQQLLIRPATGQGVVLGAINANAPVSAADTRFDITAAAVRFDQTMSVHSLALRGDAGGLLTIASGAAPGQTVTITTSATSGRAVELAADSTVDIAAAVKLRGSGGEFALSPATPTRAMVIGDLASDPGALRMLARGGFDSALDGFSALVIGSDQQQGSITMGQSGTGLSFADPVVVRVKPDGAVPVRLQNEIRGVSLTIGTGSVVVSSGPLLGFTDRIEFGGTLQVAGSTTLQARTIDFRGGAGSVTAPTSATLTLQPDTKTGAIRLGGNEAAGTFVLDTDSIAALAAGGGRVVVGYDASAGNGGRGDVSVVGSVDVKRPLSVFGGSLSMTAADRLSGNDVQIRLTGNATVSEIRGDTSVAVYSTGGVIQSADAALLNISTRSAGSVPLLVVSGKGPAVGSGQSPLRAAADSVNVMVPAGGVDRAQLANGTTRYLGYDANGRYLMLNVTAGQSKFSPSIYDPQGDNWQQSQLGAAAVAYRATPSATTLLALKSLDTTPVLAPSGGGSAPVLKSLNTNTQAYLQSLGSAERVSVGAAPNWGTARTGDGLLDELFDPLEADRATDPSQLENAWLLGTPSYLPGVTGADTIGASAYEYWSDDDELSI